VIMSRLAGDCYDELAALPADMLMLAHLKQCVNCSMIPTVSEGDVDVARYLSVLTAQGYHGPLVFENPPHPQALEFLSASFDYVRSVVANDQARL
jgi:sugar phosphate isomerase/epimerase